MRISGVAAVAAALLIVSGCGAAGDSSAKKAASSPAKSPTATQSAPYSAVTATPSEKWREYQRLLDVANVTDVTAVTEDEAPSVAKHLCDNTLSDMKTLVDLDDQMYSGKNLDNAHVAHKLFVRAYCPDSEVLLGAAIDDAEASASAAANTPKAADFRIKIKIRKKACFGSAGCNVTFQIDPHYVGPSDLSGSYDVTYKVVGGDSGPQINTFSLKDGSASYDSEEDISTSSQFTKLKAKVTDVSVQ